MKILLSLAPALAIAITANTSMAAPQAAQGALIAVTTKITSTVPLVVAVAYEPLSATSNGMDVALSVEQSMSKALGTPVRVFGRHSLRDIAIGTRNGEFDALWVPSNLASSASKDDRYEMLGFDGQMSKMALMVSNKIKAFEDLRATNLYLPQEDSSASVAGIALLSDNDVPLRTFMSVFTSGNYEIASFALEKGFCKTTVLPEALATQWIATHPGMAHVAAVSQPIPGQTLVVRKALSPAAKAQLKEFFGAQAPSHTLSAIVPAAYKYVGGLSNYTPETVPGVLKVTAREVQALAKAGAQIVDVRTPGEFDAKHLPGARLLAYEEMSPRMVGADTSRDGFNVDKLSDVRRVILYCNGPECWKSFKAALRAKASNKFDEVYWFRGGIPEWDRTGLPFISSNS